MEKWEKISIWAQLFKANDIVSSRIIKIYIEWYANTLKFFAEKMWEAFAVQKLLTFFQQKNIKILCIESAKTVNEMTINELIKLTTLWTTGPWLKKCFISSHADLQYSVFI